MSLSRSETIATHLLVLYTRRRPDRLSVRTPGVQQQAYQRWRSEWLSLCLSRMPPVHARWHARGMRGSRLT